MSSEPGPPFDDSPVSAATSVGSGESAPVDPCLAIGIPGDARIPAAADAWRRKLLDLSKRNRALNFRPAKVSSVAIVDEQPAEVFRHIVLRERAMRFKAAPEEGDERRRSEPGAEEAATAGDQASPSTPPATIDDEYQVVGVEFAPYDPTRLDERHTDDWLQTASSPEMLDKSLRRLDEQARLTIEEQGVNTLFLALGILHFKESPDADQMLRAPLVLVPAALSRKSARSGYSVRAGEEDPIVNPALAEYLRLSFGIQLPRLPDSGAMPDDYDLQDFLGAVRDLTTGRADWAVTTDIFLAPFSFQKFVMYKDLEQNASAVVQHRLIRQLVTRRGDVPNGHVIGLPVELRQMDLDREYPPEQTAQVVDADSSQLRAIAVASRGYDLVIEGPPGTGKSQTITNLIAQALAVGKSVLFVAEKMAALSVVHDRLVRARLGEFCLELHSTKANKREVMKELAASLDASLQGVVATTSSTRRLPHVRATLTEYARAVHTPHGALGISPYRAYGALGPVLGAPRVKFEGPIDEATLADLEQTVRDLGDLNATAAEIGDPAEHPWRDATKTFYSNDELASARDLAAELAVRLDEVRRRGDEVRLAYDLPAIETFAAVDEAGAIAEALSRSPGPPLSVLASEAWNEPPAEATALVERGRELDRLKANVARQFVPAVLEQEHAADIAYVEGKAQGLLSFLVFLDARWRAVRSRWSTYRLPSYRGSLATQANDMKQVDRLRNERQALAAPSCKGRDLFGDWWDGERSRWDELAAYVRWVVEFRGLCSRYKLGPKALAAAAKRHPDLSLFQALSDEASSARDVLASLRTVVGWPVDYLAGEPITAIGGRARALAAGAWLGPEWASFEAARRTALGSLAAGLLPAAMRGDLPIADMASAFLRAFYLKWLSTVVQQRPALERFHTMSHEERTAEFRRLDERVLVENQAALIGRLRDRTQHALQQPEVSAAMPFLRHQMARQRNLAPLRKTMREAGAAVRAIKPCFLMSPLTVAQLLDGSAPSFDLVVFDEASQLPPEDAVGAIIRGKQLVVVGDPKQLPPTNFFAVTAGMANAATSEDGTVLYEDAESVLEEYLGAGIPSTRLKWHYRSVHESLIAFSNLQFYQSDLRTFPSVETGTFSHGLQLEHIPDGVYEGKGLNAVEARRVADEVVRFAKEQLDRRAHGAAMESLGVGTFNLRQQLAIQDELEQRRRHEPSIEPFFDRGMTEPFFVKNLENIQGDERDVIFISVTYARAADGRLRYNFGPLNGENGWRRLNVLATRARKRMRVFASMRGDEISAAATTSRGASLLREFLIYAERGRLESVSASLAADTESPFEADVLRELDNRGLRVLPQVGTSGYRIDLGVLDDAVPGKFLCGIECDGVAYHEAETARDRDRLRQQVLEARGWTIHRVWSTDWFKDRQGQIERLLRLVQETKRQSLADAEVERQAAARLAEESALRQAEDEAAAERAAAELMLPISIAPPYERPVVAAYVMTPGEGQLAGRELLEAPTSQLAHAIRTVVEYESPIHETDLCARVAGIWGQRAGSRIQARIVAAAHSAERDGLVAHRGHFYWSVNGACVPRSRAGTRIPADRIAPEEYEQTVLAVLAGGHGFSRPQLVNEVRAVFGFSRTGAVLEDAIGGVIDRLLASGVLGEASTGIRRRQHDVTPRRLAETSERLPDPGEP